MSDPAEERERIRKANENVERWESKFIGNGGFSGGVRMTVETQDGLKASRVTRYGDLAISEKIMPPEMTRPTPKVETVMTPPLPPDVPYVITQPKPWWRRLLNLFLAEKTK